MDKPPLSFQQLTAILLDYGITGITSYSLLHGGSENTNYLVAGAQGSFVLTLCEQKTRQEAQQLADLLEYLKKAGFRTSMVVRSLAGPAITEFQNRPVMVKEFLTGKIREDLSLDQLSAAGSSLASLHQVTAPNYLPTKLGYGFEHFHEVEDYAPQSAFAKWLQNISKEIAPTLLKKLPKALIHSDLFYNNIIIDNAADSLIIMDFEEAAYYYRIFDIGMGIVGLCSSTDTVHVVGMRAFLSGYQAIQSLEHSELQSLQIMTVYAATAMCFWRHRNFNHTVPTPHMKNHYRALQTLAENIKKMPKPLFLE